MAISAVIPVKGKSSRLPGKNTLPFGKSNLLEHKITQLKKAVGVTEIIVSSDSDEMLDIALSSGVAALKRPDYLANESRPFNDFVKYMISNIKGEHLMYTPVTSPIIDENDFMECIHEYKNCFSLGYDSLTTVTVHQHFLMDDNGPVTFDPERFITNSQDIPKWYLCTFGCSIVPKQTALECKYIFGKKSFKHILSDYKGLDIDNEFDYQTARLLWGYYNEKP